MRAGEPVLGDLAALAAGLRIEATILFKARLSSNSDKSSDSGAEEGLQSMIVFDPAS